MPVKDGYVHLPFAPPWGTLPDKAGRIHLEYDTEETRRRWVAVAQKTLRELFDDAAARLGEAEARRLFIAATKRGRGVHGKRRKGLLPDRDRILLAFYDIEAERQAPQDRGTIPRLLAERLHASNRRGQFGPTAEAIQRHLRRLLKAQAERAAEKERFLSRERERC